MQISAPTGTSTPTLPARDGTARNSATMNTRGATAILGLLEIYTTPRPPINAGMMLSKAGASTGDCSTGCRYPSSSTPRAITSVVVMEEVAMAMVEMTSPSSLPALTLAASMALRAAGTFRFVRFPVTKPRYVPPVPSMGEKVSTSMMPTVQKMGATPNRPFRTCSHWGHTP